MQIKGLIPKKRKEIYKMSEHKIPYKIYLEESEMPKEWYNVRADMKNKPCPASESRDFRAYDC